MRQLDEILKRVHSGGGIVSVQDGQIRFRIPTGLLDPTDRLILAQHRDELLVSLSPVDSVDVDTIRQNSGKTAIVSTALPEFDQYAIDERQAIRWLDQAHLADVAAALTEAVRWFGRVGDQDQDEPVEDLATWLRENTVDPIRCGGCGGLALDVWEDLRGGLHCLRHDPPIRSRRLRAAAERIRRQGRTRTRTQEVHE